MEPGLLILGAKIQCLLYLPRRRSLDIAKDDHLPQGWRHLSDGLARLFQGASAVDGNAKGVPRGGRVRPVARPFRILWGDEPIDREHRLPLLCRSWNNGHGLPDRSRGLGEHDDHQQRGHRCDRHQEPACLIHAGALADRSEHQRERNERQPGQRPHPGCHAGPDR
jgi:hypothetical protein